MKVSIKKHATWGGDWYTLDYRPNGSKGERVREHVEGHMVALERKAAIEGAPDNQLLHPTLEAVASEYLRWCERELQPSTLESKKRRLNHWILPAFGRYRVRELSQRILDAYTRNLPKTSALYDTHHLKALITWMIKRRYAEPLNWIPEAPSYRPKVKKLPADAAEVLKVIAAIPKESHRIACLLMLLTGLRWGEVAYLRWENYKDGEILAQKTKTGQDEYMVVPPLCLEWFQRNRKESGYVFAVANKQTPPSKINRALLAASKKAGVKMSPHMFRHVSASTLYAEWNDLYAVQHHLRHTRITTTEIYTRYSTVRRRKAVDVLSEVFKVDKCEVVQDYEI